MPRPKKKTVGDVISEISDLKRRAAVQKALVSILRARYIPTDGVQEPQAHISCDGAPVPFELIEEIAYELEEGALEMEKEAVTYMAEEIKSAQ